MDNNYCMYYSTSAVVVVLDDGADGLEDVFTWDIDAILPITM